MRQILRPLAGSLAIISIIMPWYMRTDPGPSITIVNFLLSWNHITSIQIAGLLLLSGGILCLFSEMGVDLLSLGFISTILVMEDYRIFDLGQDLPWGPGFYLAIAAILLCVLDTAILLRERRMRPTEDDRSLGSAMRRIENLKGLPMDDESGSKESR